MHEQLEKEFMKSGDVYFMVERASGSGDGSATSVGGVDHGAVRGPGSGANANGDHSTTTNSNSGGSGNHTFTIPYWLTITCHRALEETEEKEDEDAPKEEDDDTLDTTPTCALTLHLRYADIPSTHATATTVTISTPEETAAARVTRVKAILNRVSFAINQGRLTLNPNPKP